MIHRDIKPANLMRTADGLVKVVDFGLSKPTAAADDPRNAVTMAGQILGTPQYMRPSSSSRPNSMRRRHLQPRRDSVPNC